MPLSRSFRERRRERALERAKLKLADLEYHLRKWGFANTPSQDAREIKQIEKARARVVRLGGDPDA